MSISIVDKRPSVEIGDNENESTVWQQCEEELIKIRQSVNNMMAIIYQQIIFNKREEEDIRRIAREEIAYIFGEGISLKKYEFNGENRIECS